MGVKTHGLELHSTEDNVEHLCERRFRCCLVNEVLASEVDVVAGAHGEQNRAFMNLTSRRRYDCQQCL